MTSRMGRTEDLLTAITTTAHADERVLANAVATTDPDASSFWAISLH
jgi:hypothetical protein